MGGRVALQTVFFFFFSSLASIQRFAGLPVPCTASKENLKTNPSSKVKTGRPGCHSKPLPPNEAARLLCPNIVRSNKPQVTTAQPLGVTCPRQHCCRLLANNVEEEVRPNLGTCRGHVDLTRWPRHPISCQACANG